VKTYDFLVGMVVFLGIKTFNLKNEKNYCHNTSSGFNTQTQRGNVEQQQIA